MKALVTGATGFIGGELLKGLEAPRVLTRNPTRARADLGPSVTPFPWDALHGPPPPEALEGVEAVFHFAGDPVAEGRWNPGKKALIRDSRVLGTRNLVEGIAAMETRPRVLVAASAVGFYGDRGDEELAEEAAPGEDFLARTCAAWEAEAAKAAAHGVRVVHLRIGVVLGKGGALRKMLLPFRLGVGGTLGSGRQWMPWIHVEDVAGLALHAARTPSLSGPVNAVGPRPVTNREFTKALGRVLRRPTLLPVPRFGLRLLFGEFADILFASQRVLPAAAAGSGYAFRHPDVEGALRAAVGG